MLVERKVVMIGMAGRMAQMWVPKKVDWRVAKRNHPLDSLTSYLQEQ